MPYKNPEKRRQANRKSYEKHKQQRLSTCLKYRSENRGSILAKEKTRNEKREEYFLIHKYGISPMDYETILVSQGGKCAICGIQASECNRRLVVDHSRATGKIRGLLCNGCNIGLGAFLDSEISLLSAIEYLRSTL
jgi:hypothetical protein